MAVDPNAPNPVPNPQPSDDPMEEMRKTIAEQNEKIGKLIEQNTGLVQRLDQQTLSPTPSTRVEPRRDDQPDELEQFILQGMDEGERAAPWADTIVKTVKHIIPRIEKAIDERAQFQVRRQVVDDEFYSFALDALGKDVTPKNLRDFERRYGKEVADISRLVLYRGDQLLPEYRQDYTRSFQPVFEELQRRHGQGADDFKPAPKPQPRAATGDRGAAPHPTAGPKGTPGKAEEVAGFVRETQGI